MSMLLQQILDTADQEILYIHFRDTPFTLDLIWI